MDSARHVLRALAVAGTALTAACSADTSPLRLAGSEPKPVTTPDFVAQSRTGGDYLPVGVSAPRRPARAKSAESQKALEAELEGARNRNEARGRAAEGAAKGAGKGASQGAGPE
ncbi:hypothetical protein J2X36_001514 [Methylobacterium sp. BE186]|uniref:hypothetical protein n=1 Tax=Methylobacterium sp. BE186 TaxID=2817715 RepID=UPI00285444C2|nr:hypothetical protein [Methylobacterium sp. BE186]MDR7036772.1 hypothetical protein [Methylobacterium sp. BE186]